MARASQLLLRSFPSSMIKAEWSGSLRSCAMSPRNSTRHVRFARKSRRCSSGSGPLADERKSRLALANENRMKNMPLIDRQDSALLLIDFQSRLMPAIDDGTAAIANAQRLIHAAGKFEI